MKPAKKANVLRVFLIEGVILLLIIGAATLVYTFRIPIQIAYHKNREKAALAGLGRSSGSEDAPDYGKRLQHHMEALVNLGYRQRHAYQTKHLQQGSVQEKQLFEDFRKKYPRSSYSVGWRPTGLEIEDLTERMPVWDELVKKHDVPIEDPCQPDAPEHVATRRP